MKNRYFYSIFFVVFCACSIGEGEFYSNPLDPARGLDPQNDMIVIAGTVYDEITNNKIQNALIECYTKRDDTVEYMVFSAYTDENGFYVKRARFDEDMLYIKITCNHQNYLTAEKLINIEDTEDIKSFYQIDFPMKRK